MRTSLLTIAALATVVSSAAIGEQKRQANGACKTTREWPGFKKLQHAFIFGDSYTTTGFNASLTQPSRTNPLGNPTYPGYTASNGPNWVDVLTVKYNESTIQTYNLAYGGATVDSTLVAPYLPTVSSIKDQVDNEWIPIYSPHQNPAHWKSDDTLFAFFDGINDVGNSWYTGNTTALNNEIFAEYFGLVDTLYSYGAKNFLFINVPPVDRSPGTLASGPYSENGEKADILAWNTQLFAMATQLKINKPDTNVFTVDSNALFSEVLNNVASFPQTAGYKNTTDYCVAYENGTPAENTFIPSCLYPVNEYFWLNSLHPTYPMQDVLGQEVAKQLAYGPNAC